MLCSIALLAAGSALASSRATPAPEARQASEGGESAPAIALQDAGAEPRRVVRFLPRAGAEVLSEVVSKQEAKVWLEPPGRPRSAEPVVEHATTTLQVRKRVGQPEPSGHVSVQIDSLPSPGGDEPSRLARSLGTLEGTRSSVRIDPATGAVEQLSASADIASLPESLPRRIDQLLRQLPSFPDEPIGLGAVWTVELPVTIAELTLQTHQTLQVVELTDTSITVSSQLAMRSDEGPAPLPGLPPGAEGQLVRFHGSGSGQIRTDLETMASSGDLSFALSLGMEAVVSGQSAKMDMKLSQRTSLRQIR